MDVLIKNNKKRKINDENDSSVRRITLSLYHSCRGIAVFPTGEIVAPFHKRIAIVEGLDKRVSDNFTSDVSMILILSDYNVLGVFENKFSVYNIKNNSFVIKERDLGFIPSCVCYCPQEKAIYFSCWSSRIIVYDAETFEYCYQILFDCEFPILGITLLNKDSLAVCSGSPEISILDLVEHRMRSAILVKYGGSYANCMALVGNGVLVSAYEDCSIIFWDINKKEQICCLKDAHCKPVESIVVINDKYIATGARDNVIKIWNIEDISSPEVVKTIPNGGEVPYYMALHPNGYLLSSHEKDIKVYDLYEFLYKDDLIDAFSKSEIVTNPCIHNAFSVFLDNYKQIKNFCVYFIYNYQRVIGIS